MRGRGYGKAEAAGNMAKRGIRAVIPSCILYAGLFLLISCAAGEEGTGKKTETSLEGQWKVTDCLTSADNKSPDDYYEDFLGRSIVIEPNRIIKSFGRWGDGSRFCRLEEDVVFQYRTVDMERMKGDVYGESMGDEWHGKYSGQDVLVITYGTGELTGRDAGDVFVVTEDGGTLCWYLGNLYYMERYREAETGVKKKELYGEWKVARLVSYQDGWKGRNRRSRLVKYREENGAYFYPEDYLGDTIMIRENGMDLYEDGKLLDHLGVEKYVSRKVDKSDYQNKKGIHDELGLTNEKIQVWAGIPLDSSYTVMDGEMVVVSESEVITRIYQGWYLLEKARKQDGGKE